MPASTARPTTLEVLVDRVPRAARDSLRWTADTAAVKVLAKVYND